MIEPEQLREVSKTLAEGGGAVAGFALESFGPIGGWREKYPQNGVPGRGVSIDPSGTLLVIDVVLDFDMIDLARQSRGKPRR